MKKIFISLSIITVLIIGFLFWRYREITVAKSLFAMGTVFEITATGINPGQAIEKAFQEIKRIETITSNQNGSELTKLNEAAGVGPVKVAPELFAILKKVAESYLDLSGSFDPTIAPIIDLWGFNPEGEPHLPAAGEISRILPLVGFEQVALDAKHQTVFLTVKGSKLDLGGIAKGYAVDRAYLSLQKSGIRSALINGGSSSIRALGKRADGKPWRLGIGHPRQAGELLGTLRLPKDRALATSADNQNFFIHNGERYSHLIDPRTGYPARDKILVTVTAPTAMEADLLSTAFFILPIPEIKAFISANPKYAAIIFDSSSNLINLSEAAFEREIR
ncbi:MAG: FAD:protein FMN transferase [Bacteroidota bacterium]